MSKSPVGKPSPVSVQHGVLPYRFTPDGELEILLITTRRSRRWIIPKGDPIKGLTPPNGAAREAFEEAGVRGSVAGKPFGAFRFRKTDEGAPGLLCQVKVFPLLVKEQMKDWPEAQQRTTQWHKPEEARAAVDDEGLKLLIARFAETMKSRSPRRKKHAGVIAGARPRT